MIERRRCPHCCRMARRAIVAEIARNMVRLKGKLVIRLVALIAIGVHELIVPVHVARLARCCDVHTGQLEVRQTVIEGCRIPGCCGMALCTVMTEIALDMVGRLHSNEVCLMALITIGVHKLIVPIQVARLALCGDMCACQREIRQAVIEGCRIPRCRCMTLCTVMAEISRYMVRRLNTDEIILMTLIAIGVDQLVVAVHVARLALCCYMRPCEWEVGCAMVERCRCPCSCGMAWGAIMAEVSRHMVRR